MLKKVCGLKESTLEKIICRCAVTKKILCVRTTNVRLCATANYELSVINSKDMIEVMNFEAFSL